jgi:AcrR family transcriptional regulator
MIAGAAGLLSRRGMAATSFSDVLAATGAPRGSLYHHFPGGKDELMAEATRFVGDRLLDALGRAELHAPREVIELFTSLWRGVLTGSDLEAGCAVAAVAVDAGPGQEQLVELAGSVFVEWQEALAERLRRVGLPDQRSRDLALLALVTMEGALVVCRAERSLEDFDRVAGMLIALTA